MIKNNTIYLGKIYLKFEKYPHYTSYRNVLNSIIFDFNFIKLVSRIKIYGDMNNIFYDPEKIERIKNEANLIVKDNSVYNKSNKYIGDLSDGWWYVKREIRADDNISHVAFRKKDNKWIGYSHRASCAFGIDDKIFESDYGDHNTKFIEHGYITIENLEQAKLSAKKFSDHMS